jgi:hypothetical protein
MKTIVALSFAMFALTVFSGCESDHHRRHGYHHDAYGGPAPAPAPVVGHGYYRDGYYYDEYGRRWER